MSMPVSMTATALIGAVDPPGTIVVGRLRGPVVVLIDVPFEPNGWNNVNGGGVGA